MKKEIFKMPVPMKITGRSSSITNAFFNCIIPQIEPIDDEIREALKVLGMTEDTVCCAYCGAPHTEWDHLNPLVKDKKPTGYISEIKNLVPSCSKCNQSKGNKQWRTWMLGDAPKSPKTRGVSDLGEKVERIENYEKYFKPTRIDIKKMVGEDRWNQYLSELDSIQEKMKECQVLSDEIRSTIYEDFISYSQSKSNKKHAMTVRDSVDEYGDKRIGEIVQTVLRSILEKGKLSDEEIQLFMTKDYSKKVMNINYPLLVSEGSRSYEESRYYSNSLKIKDKKYKLCSQWYETNRECLLKWISDYK